MGAVWTAEQKQVIDTRKENLLVSAAAGSGKTAVLVERILSLVTDREHPTDIDRLLVVTFTRAAAAEMRDRVGRALEKRLEEDPDNIHLQRQSALLQRAHISTIHSFCTTVIRNYCHLIDLDPGYSIADEGELRMLQGRVMKEMLEEQYAGHLPAFLSFADAFAPGKSDRRLEDLIQRVSDFASSNPDPDAWLESCVKSFQAETAEELQEKPWMHFLLEETARILEGAEQLAEQNLQLSGRPDGPAAWQNSMRQDLDLVRSLRERRLFGPLQRAFQTLSFARLSGAKPGEDEDPGIRRQAREGRESFRKLLTDLRNSFFVLTEEEILDELGSLRLYAEEMVRLVKEYRAACAKAKRRKNICDYSDLEHFALEILLERGEDGSFRPSQAAREMSLQFDEIMTDEYQDSNYIQEALLDAVSGAGCGKHNRFMVGDIKQSIYGFRNARPELFLEKAHSYMHDPEHSSDTERAGLRIDLSRNFRSRVQVLDAVNLLFGQLMQEKLGGIVYDDDAALYPGASYPEPDSPGQDDTELILVETLPADDSSAGLRQKEQRVRAEARAAAARLRELMKTMQVCDRDSGCMRPLQYRDCVVLLRSAAGWADIYVQVLKEEGIPAYTQSREGYFSVPEVVTVLHCLRITDNPRWDIPLAAVLRSPMVGCTDAELAQLRIACPDLSLYDAVCGMAGEQKKLNRFCRMLENWREEAPVMAVHELIRKILEDTGYGEYASSMPGGAQRQANLRMLVEKAAAFEKTGDTGLFNFIRYIERMQNYSVDDGEVSLFSEAEDIVRVTTIHKSKGLEYPVVIVSGLGKQFNTQDQKSPVLLHHLLGTGLYAVDRELRVRRPSLVRQAIRSACARDMLSEELRILYVAMTRAREKLILTGTIKNADQIPLSSEASGYHQLSGARCPLDWILQAGPFMKTVQVRLVSPDAADREETAPDRKAADRLAALREELLQSAAACAEKQARIIEFLEKKEQFRYPFEAAANLPAKMTVTEIKKASIEAMQEESGERLYPEEEIIPYIPEFMRTSAGGAPSGAARGTIYHHVLELLDYSALPAHACESPDTGIPPRAEKDLSGPDVEEKPSGSGAEEKDLRMRKEQEAIRAQLSGMAERGQLKADEMAAVDPADIAAFLHSGIGGRMRDAALRGKLWRERPFVLDIPAKEIDKNWPEGENILVQGVIDAWFEEPGGYILVDYKTDRVFSSDGHELRDKYAPQLVLYRRALETITGVPVKEMYLYSVALGREIRVPANQ